GFYWVFFNPIQKLGASGSLYSIADYFQFNTVLLDPVSKTAPEQQVRDMTGMARARGLKMMIDLVVNHCAMDSALTRAHPEWFVRQPDGKVACASCQHEGKKVVWRD